MGSQVQDWMTRQPVSVPDDASAVEALDLMVKHRIRHLPVVVAPHGRVIGILSSNDLREVFPFEVSLKHLPGRVELVEARDYRVCDLMTWAPWTVHASVSLEQAARTLAEHRIGCLPVVDEQERLVGILSETDALHALEAVLRGVGPGVPAPRSDTPVDELWAERGRIVEQLAKWQDAERALSADIHDEPRDRAERAVDECGVASLEPLSERAARRLRAIDAALERAERGRFGICERCQGHIPAPRLRVIPETTLCVRCARTTADAEEERA